MRKEEITKKIIGHMKYLNNIGLMCSFERDEVNSAIEDVFRSKETKRLEIKNHNDGLCYLSAYVYCRNCDHLNLADGKNGIYLCDISGKRAFQNEPIECKYYRKLKKVRMV